MKRSTNFLIGAALAASTALNVQQGMSSLSAAEHLHLIADSLRAETIRRGSTGNLLSPRVTEVRRFAIRIDSIGDAIPYVPTPEPSYTLTARLADSTIYVSPGTPRQTAALLKVTDSTGATVADSAELVLSDSSMATVLWSASIRRWQITNATRAGTMALSWHYNGATTVAQLTILVTTPPPPVDTTTPPTSSGVELPRAVPTWPASLATTSCTDTVTANLQTALNAARAGDVLCLSGVFAGSYTLPQRNDSGWVVVRSIASPIAAATRVRPSNAPALARVQTTSGAPALAAAPGASGWYVREIEITTAPGAANIIYAVVILPHTTRRIVLDRVYLHATPTQAVQRCLLLDASESALIHSWLDECHAKGFDAQAVWGYQGTGPVLVEDNTLAGSGENIMLGGADPTVAGAVPSDWTVRRNHIVTPPAWKGVWTKKNLLELKNARRVLVEANVFDGSWGDAQTGVGILITSANQGGACRWCGSRDITVRRNLIQRVAAPIGVAWRADNPAVDSLTRRVAVVENWADSTVAYDYDTRRVQLYAPQDVQFRRNTWLGRATEGNAYTAGGQTEGGAGRRITIDGDVLTRGRYGIMGCWTATCAPGLSLRAALIGVPTSTLAGVTFVPSLDAALAAGYGVPRTVVDAATRGVVIQP